MPATFKENRYAIYTGNDGTGNSWVDAANYKYEPDGQVATCQNTRSKGLIGVSFGFTIPDGATPVQAKARIRRKRTGGTSVYDYAVRMWKLGPVGNNEADTADNWDTDFVTKEYDGSEHSDPLWGMGGTWGPSDFRDTLFGFTLQVDMAGQPVAEADAIEAELKYETDNVWWGDFFPEPSKNRWWGN